MTETEEIIQAQRNCDAVAKGVENLLHIVFGSGHKFVLIATPKEQHELAGAIISNVKTDEQMSAILHSAYHRDKTDNALDLGEGQTKQ